MARRRLSPEQIISAVNRAREPLGERVRRVVYREKLRGELLNGEVLDTLDEAKVLVEAWRKVYNRIKPHSSLGYMPPASAAHVVRKFILWLAQR